MAEVSLYAPWGEETGIIKAVLFRQEMLAPMEILAGIPETSKDEKDIPYKVKAIQEA
jgi:hypothetical protein